MSVLTRQENKAVNTDKIVPEDRDAQAPADSGQIEADASLAPTSPPRSPADEAASSGTDEEREKRLESLKAEIARLRGG